MTKGELIKTLEELDMNDDAEVMISWSAKECAGWIVVENKDGFTVSIPADSY